MDILRGKGLELETNFLSKGEEEVLVTRLGEEEWSNDLKRRTIQYGHKYNYVTKKTEKAQKDIPEWMRKYTGNFDQMIVNSYEKGQGITKHTDHKSYFKNRIEIISLMSPCHMMFSKGKETHKILLPPRSRLVLKD